MAFISIYLKKIQAEAGLLWEHQTSVYENVAVIYTNEHAIHSNFAEASYGENSDGGPHPRRRPGELPRPTWQQRRS